SQGSSNLWPSEVIGESSGGFTFSVRVLGNANVTFRDLGTIESSLDSGERFGEATRTYHDGVVQLDQRTTADGVDLPDDGYTSYWSMLNDSQVLPDQSGIAFHNYSTISDGATVDAESGSKPGFDLELSRRFGGFGKRMSDNRRPGSWGGFLGLGLTDINAKTTGTINATLRSITDVYSLDGATPPTAPYTAPSTETVTVIGPDGTETSVVINNSILLANQPISRTVTDEAGAAAIDGFWQVKGTYVSARTGVWSRFHISRQLSIRASAGVSFHLLGVDMRYDERLEDETLAVPIRAQEQGETTSYEAVGLFGSLDVELWLTRRTGLFASFTYEGLSDDLALTLGGRTADVELSSGAGFRFGLTTLF
ncbi:MAG: hypothetical protein ACREIA_17210, partial [Opitutaceae bacterium]